MGNILTQMFFIPKPNLTEKNLPDQTGKVHIVTGGYAGCGLELVKILYQHNATIYVAGRSKEKAGKSIQAVKAAFPDSKGRLEFLKVDLGDLTSIKPAAEEFMSKETRLDVLTNNAGVMTPPKGSKDSHGRELQLGTNCLGPYLFTELLVPVLQKTAKEAPTGTVRVTWASSSATYMSPKGGVEFGSDGEPTPFWNDSGKAYAQAKAANCLLASEFANRYGKDGIISVSWNPGNLRSELQRHLGAVTAFFLDKLLLYPTIYGAYTELWSGWSPDLTASHNGAYIGPWGRVLDIRKDHVAAMKSQKEGGTGIAAKFWDWCDSTTKQYR